MTEGVPRRQTECNGDTEITLGMGGRYSPKLSSWSGEEKTEVGGAEARRSCKLGVARASPSEVRCKHSTTHAHWPMRDNRMTAEWVFVLGGRRTERNRTSEDVNRGLRVWSRQVEGGCNGGSEEMCSAATCSANSDNGIRLIRLI